MASPKTLRFLLGRPDFNSGRRNWPSESQPSSLRKQSLRCGCGRRADHGAGGDPGGLLLESQGNRVGSSPSLFLSLSVFLTTDFRQALKGQNYSVINCRNPACGHRANNVLYARAIRGRAVSPVSPGQPEPPVCWERCTVT